MSPSCESNRCRRGKKRSATRTRDILNKVRSLVSRVRKRTTNRHALSFSNSLLSLGKRYSHENKRLELRQRRLKNELNNKNAINRDRYMPQCSHCGFSTAVKTKEWNCNDFIVDPLKIAYPVVNEIPKEACDSKENKIEPQRDKALLHLLGEESTTIVGHSAQSSYNGDLRNSMKTDCPNSVNGPKSYSEGMLRYELSSDFDIEAWNCKDSLVDNSRKADYTARISDTKQSIDTGKTIEANRAEAQFHTLEKSENTFGAQSCVSMPEEWLRIMKEGLPNETKLSLRAKYSTGENNRISEPLNFPPGVNDLSKENNDGGFQSQLGAGIYAILKALATIRDKQSEQVVEILTDAGKILTDLHHVQSMRTESMKNCNLRGNGNFAGESITFVDNSTESKTSNEGSIEIISNCVSNSSSSTEISENGIRNDGNLKNSFNGCTKKSTSQKENTLFTDIEDEVSTSGRKGDEPIPGDAFPGVGGLLKQARTLHGVHEGLLRSWPCSSNAVRPYVKPMRLWWDYCHRNSINVFDVSMDRLKDFFIEITSREPKTYETLNAYKTAVLLLTPEKLEKNRLFTKFLKSIST